MSGVLRRGSLSFNCNLNENGSSSPRGNIESYREGQPRTPEISVLALDIKRLSQDLKKKNETLQIDISNQSAFAKDLSQDVDSDVISNFIGHYGWWQFVWTFILCLFQIPPTFQMFAFVFQTAEKPYWCARPPAFSDMNLTTWINLTQPNSACSVMNVSNIVEGTAFLDYFDQNRDTTHVDCTNFEYSTEHGDAVTLVQEFNLVCNRQNFLSVVEMCFLAGAAVGSVSSGWLSDSFGRKQTLMCFTFVQAVFGTILTFSTSLAMYMALRVVLGFASMTLAVVSFVLVVELVSGKWRTIIGILNIVPVAVSYVLTAGIAYYIRDWRVMQIVITLPGWVLLSIWYCVPESPRWLLARGRLNELYNLVERAAKMNGITLPSNYQKSLEAAMSTMSEQPQSTTTTTTADAVTVAECRDATKTATSNGGQNYEGDNTDDNNTNIKFNKPDIDCNANPLVVVFSKKYWRTTCLTLIVWLTLIIIYFGLTLHLSNLGGNIYLNTAIAGTVEAISICLSIFTVLKFGIRRNLIAYTLIPGICCLATNLVPVAADETNTNIGVIALAMIAKCVIGASNAIIPTYTAMQYPTVVRNFGLGMGNLAAGIALILVPYMWLLEHIQSLLPMSVMGVCGIVGAIALLMMKDIE